MPSRWEIPLPGAEPDSIRWEHLHAAISTWFDDNEDQHHDKVKPYTITPPRDGRPHPALEVGLLRDDLAPRIQDRWAPGRRLRLGKTVITSTTGPRLLAATSWDELGSGHLDRAWCLRFATPVTFRRGNRFTPLPAPSPILGSLRRSWNTFAPTGNSVALDLASDPVWVSDIDGHNEVVPINGRTVSGFVGRLRLECDSPDPTTRAVGTVLRLAPFAGVGAYTTRCFGVTRIDPTWQPRDR
jgi:CRISPR-associated endoribonuclease Cas6